MNCLNVCNNRSRSAAVKVPTYLCKCLSIGLGGVYIPRNSLRQLGILLGCLTVYSLSSLAQPFGTNQINTNAPPAAIASTNVNSDVFPSSLRYPPLSEAQNRQAENALQVLKIDISDADKVTWYQFDVPHKNQEIYLYIGRFKSGIILARIVIHHEGERLNMQKFTVRTDHGNFTMEPTVEVKRETGYDGARIETWDEEVGTNIITLEKIISSTKCVITLESATQYIELPVTREDKIRMAQMLLVYRHFGGNFEK